MHGRGPCIARAGGPSPANGGATVHPVVAFLRHIADNTPWRTEAHKRRANELLDAAIQEIDPPAAPAEDSGDQGASHA